MPNPASTSPPPPSPTTAEEEPALEATMPGFNPPPSPRPPDPLPPDATIRPPASDEAWPSDTEPDGPESGTSSSGGPSATPSPASIDPSFFIEIARTGVGIASLGVGWLRARRHGPAIAQAWVADEEDTAGIGDPLARIAARRVPAAAGAATPDVVDGIEAVMGTVGYGLKHAKSEAELITQLATGADLTTDEEQP